MSTGTVEQPLDMKFSTNNALGKYLADPAGRGQVVTVYFENHDAGVLATPHGRVDLNKRLSWMGFSDEEELVLMIGKEDGRRHAPVGIQPIVTFCNVNGELNKALHDLESELTDLYRSNMQIDQNYMEQRLFQYFSDRYLSLGIAMLTATVSLANRRFSRG